MAELEPDQKYAYCTDDPAALDAYRQASARRHEFTMRLRPAAAAIGGNLGPVSAPGGFGGPEEILGLMPDGSGQIPAGWRLRARPQRLEPATGRAGNPARKWLSDFKPPPDVDPTYMLKTHGLAYQSRIWKGATYTAHHPLVFEHDGLLWACYLGQPEGDDWHEPHNITWPAVDVDDFVAAMIARRRAREHA